MKWFTAVLGAYLLIFSAGCAQQKLVTSAKITRISTSGISLVRGSSTVTPILGDILYSGDVIQTDGTGWVYLIVPDAGLVTVQPGSVLEMRTLLEGGSSVRNALGLKSGKIFCFLKKLRKDQQFEVQIVTSVVGVRGTSFSVTYAKDVLVEVLSGVVSISNNETGTSTEVVKFKKAVLPDGQYSGIKVSNLDEAGYTSLVSEESKLPEEVLTGYESMSQEVAVSRQEWESMKKLKTPAKKAGPLKW